MRRDVWSTCPFLRLTLCFILGILLADTLGTRMPFGYAAGAAALFLAAYALLCALGPHHRGWPVAKTLCLFLSTAAVGALDTAVHNRPQPPLPHHYEAVVVSQPVVHGKVVMFDMLLTQQPFAGRRVHASLLRDTLTHRWQHLRVGDGIEAHSTFEPTRYHGDEAQTFILPNQWTRRSVSLLALSPADRTLTAAMRLRARLLGRAFPHLDQQSEAIVAAMVLGDKSYLDKSTKEAFSVSGASHVLALSGLHLGMIYGVLMLILGRRRGRRAYGLPALVQTVVVGAALWAFVVLVGASPSVVRSATMITIYMIASLGGHRRMALNTIALTAFAMLALRPDNLSDIGFQLSFAAVAAIVVLMRADRSRLLPWPLSWAAGCVAVSVAAQVGTFPLVLYHFGRFSCYFVLTNLIVIPLTTAILALAVALIAASFSATLTAAIAQAMVLLARWMGGGVAWVAALPGASVDHAYIGRLQVAALYVGVAAAVWLARKFVRRGAATMPR